MMVRRSAALCLLFLASASGYVNHAVAGTNRSNKANIVLQSTRTPSPSEHVNSDLASLWQPQQPILSARTARIVLPSLLVFGKSFPAHAGIGTPLLFEEARKKSFPGSLRNSVISLRVASSLRKRGYQFGGSLVSALNKSDLGVTLSKQFADGRVTVLDETTLDEYTKRCSEEKKRSLVVIGPQVTVSAEGEVGAIDGNDVLEQEKYIQEKLVGKVPEIAILGGVFIHTPKEGKERGEDYFQPCLFKTIYLNGVKNWYEEAFGDLATPQKWH